MEKLPYRILRIPVMNVACYLVYNEKDAILVDTGNRGSSGKILEMLDHLQLDPSILKLVIITHGHYDHAGSADEIKKRFKVPIAVQKEDAHRLTEGYGPLPAGTRWKARILVWVGRTFLHRLGRIPKVEPDIVIEDDMDLSTYGIPGKVIHTPGHTLGSVVVYLEGGDVIAGDSIFGIPGKEIFPPFADETQQLLESWKKLLDLPARRYYPGHGRRISRKELEAEYPRAVEKYGVQVM